MRAGKNTKKFIGSLSGETTVLPGLSVLLLLLIINIIVQPNFFSGRVLNINMQTLTPMILAAMAQGFIIISGGIDLSIGSSMSLFTIICASLFNDSAAHNVLVLVLATAVVLVVGLFNGFLVGILNMQPLITTFASSAVVLGVSLIIMPSPGGYVPKTLYKIYHKEIFGIIPVALLILAIALILWLILSKTSVYRYAYAIGDDFERAFSSGVRVGRVKMLSYVIGSVFIAFAGFCLLLMTATGSARSGSSYTLNSVAAVVIGGISLNGGKGSLWGALIGSSILLFALNIIFFAEFGTFSQEFAKGLIIVLSLVFAGIMKVRQEKTGASRNE